MRARRVAPVAVHASMHHRDPLSDADAHRRQPPAAAAPAQLVRQRGQQPRAGVAERVPERDRAAVDVDDRRVELLPLGQAGERLRRERLVELDRGEVAPADAGALQRLARRLDGADAVELRLDGAGGAARDPRQRRRPPSAESSSAEAPSFIGDELPAVTVPSLRNTGFSVASFSSVVSARMFSSRSSSLASRSTSSANAPRSQAAPALRWLRERERVLLLARDAVPVGEDLGALAERRPSTRRASRGLTIRQPSVVECIVSLVRGNGLSGFCTTHGARLIDSTPPAMQTRLVAGRDRAAGAERRLHARAAQAVDGRAGDRGRQAGEQHGHAGDVAVVLARLVGVAEVDLVDGLEVVALGQRAHDGRGEVVGPRAGQRAAELADRRAHGVADEDLRHSAPAAAASSSAVGGSVVSRSSATFSSQPVASRACSSVDPGVERRRAPARRRPAQHAEVGDHHLVLRAERGLEVELGDEGARRLADDRDHPPSVRRDLGCAAGPWQAHLRLVVRADDRRVEVAGRSIWAAPRKPTSIRPPCSQ